MMSNKNGIKVDLNRVKKWDYREWIEGRDGLTGRELDLFDAGFSVRVIEAWPFGEPVTLEGYKALGALQQMEVDDAVSSAIKDVSKKK
jgi:hypothetical protein